MNVKHSGANIYSVLYGDMKITIFKILNRWWNIVTWYIVTPYIMEIYVFSWLLTDSHVDLGVLRTINCTVVKHLLHYHVVIGTTMSTVNDVIIGTTKWCRDRNNCVYREWCYTGNILVSIYWKCKEQSIAVYCH